MPQRIVKQHIGAIQPLFELGELAKRLAGLVLRRNATYQERKDVLDLSIKALQGLGYSSAELSGAIHSAYPQEPPIAMTTSSNVENTYSSKSADIAPPVITTSLDASKQPVPEKKGLFGK